MRYSASEKFEIIELVEQSSLSDPTDTGADRDPEIDVLRPLPGGRDRSSGGWQAEAAADLEQDP
jgi:hypothetical protein